jgi:hypothetical protein
MKIKLHSNENIESHYCMQPEMNWIQFFNLIQIYWIEFKFN